ncbi:MAG: hypothetical protein M0C28_41525 [Candidatus Moduliflexus flocculans]|nr:hypothetical protein [Candidatus Moduliflexus flocculans]
MKRLIAAAAAAFVPGLGPSRTGIAGIAQARSDHYSVWAEAGPGPGGRARQDPGRPVHPLRRGYALRLEDDLRGRLTVRVFRDKAGFDAHLTRRSWARRSPISSTFTIPLPSGRSSWSSRRKSPDFSASLAHQAYVQYLKAFIPESPALDP